MKFFKKIAKIWLELGYFRRVNVIYEHETEGQLFVERIFAYEVSRRGEAIIWKGKDYRVGTVWHDKDKNFIEVTLSDL